MCSTAELPVLRRRQQLSVSQLCGYYMVSVVMCINPSAIVPRNCIDTFNCNLSMHCCTSQICVYLLDTLIIYSAWPRTQHIYR